MTLAELGAQLREERIRQDIVLEEAASRLKIAARVLRAIEDGETAELPHIVYVRGFIKSYSNMLGYTAEERADMLDSLETEVEEAPRLSTRSPSMDYHATRQKSRAFSLLLKVFLLTAIGVGGYVYYINNIREQGPEMANWELGQMEVATAENTGSTPPSGVISPEGSGSAESAASPSTQWKEAEPAEGAKEETAGFFSFFTDLFDELFASSDDAGEVSDETSAGGTAELPKITPEVPQKTAENTESASTVESGANLSTNGPLVAASQPVDDALGENAQAPVNAVPSVTESTKPVELQVEGTRVGSEQPPAPSAEQGTAPLQRSEADPVAPRGLTPLGAPQELGQNAAATQATPVTAEAPASAAADTAEKILPAGTHEIVVVAEDMCWMQAKADGVTRETTLRKGESFTMTFKNSLSLRLGNAGGVNIEYDGKPMPKAGNLGQVKTVTFPPKS